MCYYIFIFHETLVPERRKLLTLIILSNFYMVWKTYCRQFPSRKKKLLVSDYGLNQIDVVCICHVSFVNIIYQKYQSLLFSPFVSTSQLQNVLNLLLLLPIRAAEIVECVRKYMDGSSQNLQSLSSY